MERHVDFLTSYPPGDIWNDQFWGPMREVTIYWFTLIMMCFNTPHASAADGHRNLLLTMAQKMGVETDTFADSNSTLSEVEA